MSQTLKSISIAGQKFEISGEQPKFETYEFLVTNDNPRVTVYSSGSVRFIRLNVLGLDKKSVCFLFPLVTINEASKNKALDMTSGNTVYIELITNDYEERPIFFIDQFINEIGIIVRNGITYSGEPVFLSNQSVVNVGFAGNGIINSSNNGVEALGTFPEFSRDLITQDGASFITFPYFFRQGIFINSFIVTDMTEF